MKKSAIILSVLGGLTSFIGVMFMSEIKDWIVTNYPFLIVGVGLFMIAIAVVLFSLSKIWGKLDEVKQKIIALKKMRDKESVRVLTHFNTQLEDIEIRLAKINKDDKFYISQKPTVNHERLISENQKTIVKEINEYNESFKDWNLENYSEGDTKPLYTKPHFDIDIK
ncbi:MAG: hypothetical protein WC389_18660 [Lutibacter sp.]|jgi:hypothetical protein